MSSSSSAKAILTRRPPPGPNTWALAQTTTTNPPIFSTETLNPIPTQSPFDWNVARTAGVEVARDCTTARSGKCSLRVSFAGTQNLGFAAASQLAFVRPGAYRFHAFIRTEALTTDQGIRFRIFDAEAPARLDEVFGQFTGSSPWSSVDHDVVVAPETRLLRIDVVRQPSMKFDNKVAGTAWIDELKLEPIIPDSPR